jgi:hypothetical protein
MPSASATRRAPRAAGRTLASRGRSSVAGPGRAVARRVPRRRARRRGSARRAHRACAAGAVHGARAAQRSGRLDRSATMTSSCSSRFGAMSSLRAIASRSSHSMRAMSCWRPEPADAAHPSPVPRVGDGVLEARRELLLEPRHAVGRVQPVGEHLPERREVHDVAGGVGLHRSRDRSRRPVGALERLLVALDREPEHLLEQHAETDREAEHRAATAVSTSRGGSTPFAASGTTSLFAACSTLSRVARCACSPARSSSTIPSRSTHPPGRRPARARRGGSSGPRRRARRRRRRRAGRGRRGPCDPGRVVDECDAGFGDRRSGAHRCAYRQGPCPRAEASGAPPGGLRCRSCCACTPTPTTSRSPAAASSHVRLRRASGRSS